VRAGAREQARILAAGVTPILANVVDADDPRHHDPAALLAALRGVAL
jgi:hypothetical protein